MAELTPYQVQHLKKFLISKYVRYEDVQLELIDHLATSIEHIMAEDSKISFEEALDQVNRHFGKGGFGEIVKEKEMALAKFWRKHVWDCFLDFYKPPLVFSAIALFSLIYSIEISSEIFLKQFTSVNASFIFLLIPLLILSIFSPRVNGLRKYLFFKSYLSMTGMALLSMYHFIPILIGFSDFLETIPIPFVLSSIYITASLIFTYILVFKIPKGLITTLKKQYQKYNLT